MQNIRLSAIAAAQVMGIALAERHLEGEVLPAVAMMDNPPPEPRIVDYGLIGRISKKVKRVFDTKLYLPFGGGFGPEYLEAAQALNAFYNRRPRPWRPYPKAQLRAIRRKLRS